VRILAFALLVPGFLLAQAPRVGVLDFYGVRRVPAARLRKTVGVKEGDRLPGSKGDIEDRLERVPGVVLARVEAVCCEGQNAILYVGIEERGAPHFEFRPSPHDEVALPPEAVDAYHAFLQAVEDAARAGGPVEAVSLQYGPRFRALAQTYLEALRRVLRESSNPEQRAIAAYLIAYAPNKPSILADLQYALQDSDESVRANAVQSLTGLAAQDIPIQPTWLVEMLNSIAWNDRFRAAKALVALTDKRPPALIQELRSRALPALVEMAQWKTLAHALPAFLLVGRIAGLSDMHIHQAWARGDRLGVIARAIKK
jgi:hypothetical protein